MPTTTSASSHSHHICSKHSPSATLDLLILLLVLFSCTFLLTSSLSSLSHSLYLLLSLHPSYLLGFLIFFTLSLLAFEICCTTFRSRKCHNPACKGLKKAMEFDILLQTDDCLRSGSPEIDQLPWKGGAEGNPDYDCFRSQLKKMAPPNGRAVLLFRASCGCPVAKLEAWGAKRGRRHKK